MTNNYFKVWHPTTMIGIVPFDDADETSIKLAWAAIQAVRDNAEALMPPDNKLGDNRNAFARNRSIAVWRSVSAVAGPWLSAQVVGHTRWALS